jgi:hypothetical protein
MNMESMHNLSEENDDSVWTNEVWHGRRNKDMATVPKFTMCEHDFNNVVASFLSADSSSLD